MAERNKDKNDDNLLFLSLLSYFGAMSIDYRDKVFRATIAENLTYDVYNTLNKFKANKNNIPMFRRNMIRTFIIWIFFTRLIDKANLKGYEKYIKENYGVDLETIKPIPEEDVFLDSGILGAATAMMVLEKLEDVANEIVDSTLRNIDDVDILSIERAERIAMDEANRFSNMIGRDVAKEKGYKYHVWHTMEDKRVRKSHKSANGQKKAIGEPFVIGDSLMMFPMDDSLGASINEIIGCRCSVSYE